MASYKVLMRSMSFWCCRSTSAIWTAYLLLHFINAITFSLSSNHADRRFDPLERLVLPHHLEHLVDAGADGAAGQGHAHRLGELPELDAFFGYYGVEHLLHFSVRERLHVL